MNKVRSLDGFRLLILAWTFYMSSNTNDRGDIFSPYLGDTAHFETSTGEKHEGTYVARIDDTDNCRTIGFNGSVIQLIVPGEFCFSLFIDMNVLAVASYRPEGHCKGGVGWGKTPILNHPGISMIHFFVTRSQLITKRNQPIKAISVALLHYYKTIYTHIRTSIFSSRW